MDSGTQQKKICFAVYNCNNYGGAESVAINMANSLIQENEVFYLGIVGDATKETVRLHGNIKKRTLLPKKQQSQRLRIQLAFVFKSLKTFLKNENIDILVLIGHYPAFLTAAVRPFVKIPFVFCDHGALINQWDDKKTTAMRYIASKVCDKTVALTERTYNDYIEKLHLNPKKITFIYNWIESLDSDSKEYNIDSQKVLSVGRLSKEKGFNQLIKAMTLVVKKHPDWVLDIYGDGEEEGMLKKLISEHDLGRNVVLKGMRNNVRDYYKDYAAYVMPSYREGLPLTLLEAKINMLPIVSFDVNTGPREIVRDGTDGILVEPKNIKALADAMCTLIENRDLRKRYSDNAKGNLDLFSKEKIIPQWKELFEEIAR